MDATFELEHFLAYSLCGHHRTGEKTGKDQEESLMKVLSDEERGLVLRRC